MICERCGEERASRVPPADRREAVLRALTNTVWVRCSGCHHRARVPRGVKDAPVSLDPFWRFLLAVFGSSAVSAALLRLAT